jgi:hypothetical protein
MANDTSTLLGNKVSRTELLGFLPPEGTDTWKPIAHSSLVDTLEGEIVRRGLSIRREEYAVSNNGTRLFGIMDIEGFDNGGTGAALALRAGNDKSLPVQIIVANRVFVCDNMAFSGQGGTIALKKRHTKRLDLASEISPALDRYFEALPIMSNLIERMQNHSLSTACVNALLIESFTSPASPLPIRLLPTVKALYFDDTEQRDKFPDRSLWSLNNAYTEAFKSLKPEPFNACSSYLGQLCHTATE